MKFNTLNSIIFAGLVAIVGVLVMQLLMLNKAYDFEKKEFAEKIHFALQDVVQKIYRDNQSNLQIKDQVKKVSEDYYIVNIDDVFEAEVLEYYLKTEFKKVKLDIDFEYAIYDCASDEMVYGNYITSNQKTQESCENCFQKKEGLIYYFGVRFPNLKYNFISSLQLYWIYTLILIFVLVIYVYSVFKLLQQKKYSELQKDFINNMTHEFKTPLASILIASNYAMIQEEVTQNAKLSKYMAIIIQQSNKLNQHIERILTVAKSEGKWIHLEPSEINLSDMLKLISENALLKYNHKPEINCQVPENILIFGDEFHVYNLIFNLVDNGIKYGGNQPVIDIHVAIQPKETMLTIEDSGSGISEKDMEYIFDKFYRVPREDKKEVAGFGLGLFYVKKMVDLHGWKIKMISQQPKGLKVILRIPNKLISN